MLYLERPRAKSWELRRCVGALQIQRLEGSRPRGLWDLYLDEPVVDRLRDCGCCRCAWVSVAGRRENGRGAVHRRVWSAQPYCILRNARQRTSVRAEARARFEAGDVDSCGAPAEMRRRSEEKLRGGEALDNLHGSAAERTVPRRVNGERGQRSGAYCWLIGWLEQPQTKRKEFCSPPVSEEAEVADAHKAARQQVQQEAA